MSYTSNQINQQSLNGILSISDGYITIENGEISGASKITAIELNSDLLISATANIGSLGVGNLYVNKLTGSNIMSNQTYSTLGATYSFSTGYLNSGLLQTNQAVINNGNINTLQVQNINILPSGLLIPSVRSTIPEGWLLCNGTNISRSTYNSLFSVIGTTYGAGDGITTFGLPNITGVSIGGVSVNYLIKI